ncbi:hypothetical protein COC42_04390 [Sphingomonas spermidinifaciens]|uniref:Secreted protein n=1 Tax=Sphingomonas spermidinifaciens TaxID=1141889 RepID=A0A2A4B748_9SPHN|nr:hypothetical protein [Sphingomonas spermidinifaciens]PCD03609.1 hypothetical protein COC42_04390 [Sphingomonas spermidinifaciens]
MSSSIPTDRPRPARRRALALAAALSLVSGCSAPEEAAATGNGPAVTETPAAPAPKPSPAAKEAGSRILAAKDFTLRGKPACKIDFVYAGHPPEDLFWEEPCSAVTARLMTNADLRALGRWDRLDEFAQQFVHALPGGRVLYVEGSHSASVYPIGTTGETYEVAVAD